jgi:hypothetical protein
MISENAALGGIDSAGITERHGTHTPGRPGRGLAGGVECGYTHTRAQLASLSLANL